MTSSTPRRLMRSRRGSSGSWARTVAGPGSITSVDTGRRTRCGQPTGTHPAKHDRVVVDDDKAAVCTPALDAGHQVIGCARGGRAVGGVERPALGGVGPHGRQAGGHPVDLAGGVVVHRAETEPFEQERGSGAHVAQRVPAVDDHRPGSVQHLCGAGVELLERQVQRAG